MFDLPLFPLNLVLFPGMPLHLHIFEDRYKKLVQSCLVSDRTFGVALIQKGQEAMGPLPEPYSVGCTARIIDVQPMEDGRMNLIVVGRERFRILSVDRQSAPYLIARVEKYPLKSGNRANLHWSAAHLRPRVERYLELLIRLSDVQKDPEPLPDDSELIAYLAAILLQIPFTEKQELLETETSTDLFNRLDSIFDRELALLRAMLSESSRDGIGPFSRN